MAQRGEVHGHWRELDRRLRQQAHLFGDRRALADMAIFPFVRQFALVDRTWFDGEPWARLRAWLDELLALSLFADAMQKYAQWREGDAPVLFGGAGSH